MSEEQSVNGAKLPAAVSAKLLTLLSSDDAFRELFTHDPSAALTEAGYVWGESGNEENDSTLRVCCKVKSLASKETIEGAKEQLLQLLTGKTGQISQIVPNLDAGLDISGRSLK